MEEEERISLLGRKQVTEDEDEAYMFTDHVVETPLRVATEENPSMRRKSRRDRILARRGSFRWLPVAFSNDLVHGSWWFVAGSVIATLIPVVPVVELFYPFWPQHASTLPLLQDVATFGLLIFSGIFFTLGSLVFVRAFEEPPLKPLFKSEHLATDELLASWLFLVATIPFVPFMAVYVYYNSDVMVYWGCLVGSIIFVLATYFFVLSCYPIEEIREQIIPQIAAVLCGRRCWIQRHLSNDWLAAMWIFYYGTVLMCLGSALMLYLALQDGNQLEIFDWATSLFDSLLFLMGCAYFVAGSYPQAQPENLFSPTGVDDLPKIRFDDDDDALEQDDDNPNGSKTTTCNNSTNIAPKDFLV